MGAWSDADWRRPIAERFVAIAQRLNYEPKNKNALNRLVFDLAKDTTLEPEFQKRFHELALMDQRGRSTFITGAINRFWVVATPDIGRTTPETYQQNVDPEVPAETRQTIVAVKKTEPVAAKPAAQPRPSAVKLKPQQFVVSLLLDNTYDNAQVSDVLKAWLSSQLGSGTLTIDGVSGDGLWKDFLVTTDVVFPMLRRRFVQIPWVKDCLSKPIAEFGMYLASAES